MMKKLKVFLLLVGMSVTLTSPSARAIPFEITFTGGTPLRYWGTGWAADGAFKDIINITGETPAEETFHLEGINSILVTWDAPAGYVYVVRW